MKGDSRGQHPVVRFVLEVVYPYKATRRKTALLKLST